MSGLSIASLDFSSLNLLDKESALVYQHFKYLRVATVATCPSEICTIKIRINR